MNLSEAVTEYLLAVHRSDWTLARSLAVNAVNFESPGTSNLVDLVLELASRFAAVLHQEAELEDVPVSEVLDVLDDALAEEPQAHLANEHRVGKDVFRLVRAVSSGDQLGTTMLLGDYDNFDRIGDLMMGLATGILWRAGTLAERKGVPLEKVIWHSEPRS